MATRPVRPLDGGLATHLRQAEFTYREVGATAGAFPAGYRHFRTSADLGVGGEVFERARDALLTWQVQRAAGLQVQSSDPHIAPGGVAVLVFRLGPLRLEAPVRVVDVVDDGSRASFTYGTLPGHPESGEERFDIHHLDDGRVVFSIAGFSRPQSGLARTAGRVGSLVQDLITRRYLAALTR
jgi:uncharacterized protein (UPF0548 family)